MKLFFLVALLSLAAATFPADNETHIHGETGWYVPQWNGSFVWMSNKEAEFKLHALELRDKFKNRLSTSEISFYLYTRRNRATPVQITNAISIARSHFNPRHPTRFVIHGWTQSYKDFPTKQVANAWLSVGKYNLIMVDWGRARTLNYISSVVAVPGVGKRVAKMVDHLVKRHDMPLKNLIVIGHSLGAHVAGYTGKNIKSGRIRSIVGLNPAMPLFRYDRPKQRLSSTDAFYVETIQTNGGLLGFLKPIGKGSFYPSGGTYQPGCGVDIAGLCSHFRPFSYYAEAVTMNNFPTVKCRNYEDAANKACGNSYSGVRMGAISNINKVSGTFYVPIRSSSPFGVGKKFV